MLSIDSLNVVEFVSSFTRIRFSRTLKFTVLLAIRFSAHRLVWISFMRLDKNAVTRS